MPRAGCAGRVVCRGATRDDTIAKLFVNRTCVRYSVFSSEL